MINFNHTHNGVVLLKPKEDKADIAVFFPLEFLNQNDLTYSMRWVYNEPQMVTTYSMVRKFAEINVTGE